MRRLGEHRAIMGSGGVIVLDDTACMVNVAKSFLAFTADESCPFDAIIAKPGRKG
ncbi:MAG: hypothetical protein R6U88_04835 [Candidatus Bipolaricaulota bacterium]